MKDPRTKIQATGKIQNPRSDAWSLTLQNVWGGAQVVDPLILLEQWDNPGQMKTPKTRKESQGIQSSNPIPAQTNNSNLWWDEQDSEGPMLLKDGPPAKAPHEFDLEQRTAVFGENVIRFLKTVPRSPTNDRLIDQLVGAATSIGANYCEANEGVSKRDFRHPISRCVKEAKETKFFLRMIAAAEPSMAGNARDLYREASELLLIFASMYRK